MRYTLLTCLISLISLLPFAFCGANSDPHGVVHSHDSSPKAWYDVTPASDTDYNLVASFITETVGTEHVQPSTHVGEDVEPMSWIVEADSSQVTRLIQHSAIKRVARIDDHAAAEALVNSHQVKRDEQAEHSCVFPNENANQDQLDEIAAYLKQLTNEKLWDHRRFDGTFGFWTVDLTASQLDQASKHPGVSAACVDPKAKPRSVVNTRRRSVTGRAAAGEYVTQKNAVMELVAVSQPSTMPDITKLTDYVYEKNAGKGSYIYHLEYGVFFSKIPSEFPNLSPTGHLQTPLAKSQKRDPGAPDYRGTGEIVAWSHSTCTATKAVGKKYGVAKEATLVVVQLGDDRLSEYVDAVYEIMADLVAHPERRKHSVVTCSMGWDLDGSQVHQAIRGAWKSLMDMDVPIVVVAGNDGKEPGHQLVDAYPGFWAGAPDFPIIVVGSVNGAGEKSDFSQGGNKVAIHAVADDITCYYDDFNTPGWGVWGTSYAAPQVAGQLAIWLSRDVVPFDTTTGKLARNALDYIRSSPDAGWSRVPGIRTLWNGVKDEDVPLSTAAFNKVCSGPPTDHYVDRETLRQAMEDDSFCDDYVNQGSISRRYKQDTMNDVIISIDHPADSPYKRTKADCQRYLLGELTDGCDAANNPPNWKAGGTVTLGDVTLRIQPQATRQPSSNGIQARCDSTYKAAYNRYWLWGHGFANDDWGAELKKQLAGCALDADTWKFDYGLGSDGREWTAEFHTLVFQKKCVGHAFVTSGAPKGTGCHGSGR